MTDFDLDRAYGTVGHSTNAELRMLAKYAELSPAAVVELGTYLGRATIALAIAAKVKPVVTVDMFADAHLFSPGGPQGGFEYRAGNLAIFSENVQRAGMFISDSAVSGHITLIRKDTVEAAKDFGIRTFKRGDEPNTVETYVTSAIGLLFVDADHNYEPLRADLAAWTPYIVQGGYLALHDYNDHEWGVTTNARELEATGEWERIDGVHSLIVYRRIGKAAQPPLGDGHDTHYHTPAQQQMKPAAKRGRK